MHSNRPGSLLLRRSLYFVLILALVSGFGAVQPAAAAGPGAAQSSPNASIQGVPYTGGQGIPETTGQIMARQALVNLQPAAAAARPAANFGASLSRRQNNPASAGLVQGPSAAAWISPFGVQAGLAQTIGLSFDGPSSAAGTPCAATTPPDSMGAVGPTQFIVALNCNIVSYNKTTGAADGVLNATPNTFFASVRNGVATSDPHIRYDRTSGRWFITMITVAAPNRILLAVSSEANITSGTTWTKFFIEMDNTLAGRTTCVANSPTLGVDVNAVYIGVNQNCPAYLTSDAYVIQKSSVTGGTVIKSMVFRDLVDLTSSAGPFDPQGVDNPNPAASEGYMIAIDGLNFGMLQLLRVKNPGGDPGDPTIANRPTLLGPYPITTASTNFPYNQPHKGNNLLNAPLNSPGQLDAGDGRLLGADFRDGSLWTTLVSSVNSTCNNSVPNDRDAIFWYEITGAPTGLAPAVFQSGSVCDLTAATNPAFYSYGTIMVNGQGHAVIGYTKAGATNYTTPGFSGRLSSDPLGVLEGTTDIVAGTHPYVPAFDTGLSGPRLWGNYSYTSLDPCDDMTMWTIQEYASANNQWGERIARIMSPPPAALSSAGPSRVTVGQPSVNVVIMGTSSSGSGFYDTPASLTDTCRTRLTAAVSGGVTVTSVTFTDPTHLTLNISTTGATPGSQNITITNPDGQSVVGTAILTVSPGTTTTVTATPNPSSYNQSVTFTATVSPLGSVATPTGTAKFYDGATLLSTVALSAGKAQFVTAALATGTHTITAVYSGDTTFTTSTGTLSGGQVVQKAVAGIALSGLTQVYQAVPLSVTASTTPPGLTVVITYNGSSTPPTDAGSYPVSAVINDLNYTGTATGQLVISPASTHITLTSSANPSLKGQPVKFTVTVTSSPGLIPVGSVGITVNGTLSLLVLPGTGFVTVDSNLPGGANNVSALYSGSANFGPSGPVLLTQTVDWPTYMPVVFK